MIKNDIKNLLEEYKQDFFNKTGIELICYPALKLRRIPIEELIEFTNKEYDADILSTSRLPKNVISRKMFLWAARDMGYSVTYLAEQLKYDRTTIIYHTRPSNRNSFMVPDEIWNEYLAKLTEKQFK